MSAEADQMCAATGNSRNGYRERTLTTCVGTLTLRVPKLRSGSFFPDDVLERYQRVDRAIVAAVAEMYATGTSTRKVQKVAQAMGVERLSKDQVSAICGHLDAEVGELVTRPLGKLRTPYLWIDAAYVKCRRDRRVASTAVVTAIGCDEGGLAAGARPRRRGHRGLRLLAGLPAEGQGPRGARRGARDLRRPPRARKGRVRGLPGRRLAALRRPPHARLRPRGRIPPALEAGLQDRRPGLQAEGGRRRARRLPPRGRHARLVLPGGRGRPRGDRAGRPGLPGLPAEPLEAPAHQQRAGARQSRDQAQVAGGAGLPLGLLAGAPGRRGHVRHGRGVVGCALLLRGQDGRAL